MRGLRSMLACSVPAALAVLLAAVPGVAAAARPEAAATLSAPGAGAVRIVRDEYGVPHVYAANARALFYGEGYAVGQDRLWQAELLRRTGTGTIAEMPRIGGPGSVPGDLSFREYTGGQVRLRALLRELPPSARVAVTAFSDGMNAWIGTARLRHELPPEYGATGLAPRPWTPEDVIATWFVAEQQYGLSLIHI